MRDNLKKWLKERLPIEALNYQVPSHANTWLFSLGGITFLSFVVLVISGIILAQFYSPEPETANQSIRLLVTEVRLGGLIRGLHFWAAQVVMVTLVLHLLRVFFYGSYKKPREANWLIGVGLFFTMVGLYYTGTILKWDQEASEALAHAREIAGMLGPLGLYFSEDFAPAVSLLGKFFTLHTSLLPMLILALGGLHLLLVKASGISPLPWKEKLTTAGRSQHTFLQHLSKLAGYGLVVLGLVAFLAIILPPSLGPAPVDGVEATKPPWIFMGIFSIENWFGLGGLVAASILLAVALVAVPFIDRNPLPDLTRRKPVLSLGLLALVLVMVLSINAYQATAKQHIGMGGEQEVTTKAQPGAQTGEKQAGDQVGDKEKPAAPQTQSALGLVQLDRALEIAKGLERDLEQGNPAAAAKEAGKLDEALDAIGAQLKAKDAALRKDIGNAVHELEELLEKPNPDLAKVNGYLAAAVTKIKEAKKLF